MNARLLPLALLFALTLGCSDSPHSQDQVRRDTAAATATIASDLKGAALGVRDGLRQQSHTPGPIDLNKASRADLESLPGITPPLAGEIIAHRPYTGLGQLRKKHILTAEQYKAISPRVVASN